MGSKNIIGRRVLRIAFKTMVIVLLLQSVNYGGANTTQQINNASPEIGVTYTQEVPFSIESIAEVKVRESNQPAYIPERRVIPFHKEPPPKELPGTAPLKPQSPLQYEPTTSSLAPVLSSSFTGLLDNGMRIPPDTHGAAGPSHLVETLNSEVGFFNKSTGALISSVSLQAFWSSLGTGSGQPDNHPFDPKVIYDQNIGRFIAVTMGGSSSPGSWLMIAISNTSDPTGVWYKWAIAADTDGGVQLFNNWADYPGFGVDANYVYVTANMYSNTDLYQYGKVWVVPKTQLLNGNASITVTEFRAPTGYGFTMQPAYVFGSSSTEYLIDEGTYISGTPPRRFLNINSITFPGGTPTWTNLGYIEVSSYPTSSFPKAPQLGSSDLIDTNDARLLNAVFRNGYLWTTHTVANSVNTKTEVAWYQINPATASPSSPYGTPVQQGRISDASRWYYYPSIAVNSNGDVGIGFSGSSTSEYAGAYYTARNSSDTAGTMQSVALLKAGLASYYKTFSGTRNRWGDYSATVIDPSDNTTFWTLQEYAGTPISGTSYWGTWWGKFTLTTVTPSLSISASSSTVTVGVPTSVTFTVTSAGTAVSGATVTLSGAGVSTSGTANASGIAVISVNATSAGTISVTASATGYTSGTTSLTSVMSIYQINSCTTISSSGTYVLTQSIINSTADPCIAITSSNVTFDGSGYTIDGVGASTGILVSNSTVTVKNLIVTDWNNGIYYAQLGGVTDGNIINNTVNSNYAGILLFGNVFYSTYNITVTNNTVSNSSIGIRGYRNTIFIGNNVSGNDIGIQLIGGPLSAYGFSGDNTLSRNIITGNNIGIQSYSYPWSNNIFNNIFNNTNNADISFTNNWNTTKTSGTNIIGGPYLGGNVWAYPNGTGFSQTCTDADSNGICDSPYVLDAKNTDYLPLAYKPAITPTPTPTGIPYLVFATSPTSRIAQIGVPITLYISIINGGTATATNVSISQASSLPAIIHYQPWDGSTTFTGAPDTPVNMIAGETVHFVITINVTAVFPSSPMTFNVSSTNGATAPINGVNTLTISGTATPYADVIMKSTSLNVSTPVKTPTAFAVATSNVGAANTTNVSFILSIPSSITGLTYQVNETYPTNGTIKGPAIGLTIPVGAQPTFAVFLYPTQPIALDLVNNRITIQLLDGSGKIIGAQSVAVSTT